MMRLAFQDVARLERNELSLAVDSRNEPALRLYFRHGFERIGSRIALVRDLRSAPSEAKAVASARYTPPASV